eukprot:TRINITY_DN8341_c0_g1_i1.p2 TRINITY_DN8341_c0_g1~~TRINITY_DN8341_c0_g1_i1.p2  ORF type:complete len:311 (+),score=116.95 TRINITY_DN8341_c0_g1_i1:157-1089(+)
MSATIPTKLGVDKVTPPQPLTRGVSFGTAGLGGVIAWVMVHPFNTLAVRMSLAQGEKKSLSRYAADTVKAEGMGALYKGLGAGIVRQIFYATSRFGLFEVFRDNIAEMRGGEVDFFTRIVAGSVSGGCAALISCPAEVSLVRMSNDSALPLEQRRNYTSVFNAFSRTASEEGVGAFWRGSTPFCTRCVIVGCFQVATYDQIKQFVKSQTGLATSSVANVAFSANCASLIYSFITMPLETAKNRMAFQRAGADGKLLYTSALQTISHVAKTEGVKNLWNGYLPYYGRCGGHTVMMFIFVEELRKLYRSYAL